LSVRNNRLVALERQLKQAIRDAVNRPSRKPFSWGGLTGYRQLSAIADGIRQLVDATPETRYLQRLLSQVERALENYRALANDLAAAHSWLRRVAAVLHYRHPTDEAPSADLSSQSVAHAMEELLAAFQPDFKRRPARCAVQRPISYLASLWVRAPALLRYSGLASRQSRPGSTLLCTVSTPATHLRSQDYPRA
jgi:hypothetical protein